MSLKTHTCEKTSPKLHRISRTIHQQENIPRPSKNPNFPNIRWAPTLAHTKMAAARTHHVHTTVHGLYKYAFQQWRRAPLPGQGGFSSPRNALRHFPGAVPRGIRPGTLLRSLASHTTQTSHIENPYSNVCFISVRQTGEGFAGGIRENDGRRGAFCPTGGGYVTRPPFLVFGHVRVRLLYASFSSHLAHTDMHTFLIRIKIGGFQMAYVHNHLSILF